MTVPPGDGSDSSARVVRVGDLVDDLFNESDRARRALAEGRLLGPPIGIDAISREMGGYWPAGLHVVHAEAGCGKSAFAIQCASDVAARCAAIYVSCEMRALEIFRRIIARETLTYKGRLAPGQLEPNVILGLARRAAAANPGFVIVDATTAPAPITLIRDIAEDLKARLQTEHVLIAIDSIHAWAPGAVGDSVSEYDSLNVAVSQLLQLTNYLDCPIIGIAERNRMAMREGGLSASAGTRKLDYTPETVIELSRNTSDDEIEDAHGEVPVELRFAKNRSGRKGLKVPLKFNGALQRFRQGEIADLIPIDRPRRRA